MGIPTPGTVVGAGVDPGRYVSSTTLPLGMPAVSRGRCAAVGRSMIDIFFSFAWKWRGYPVGIFAFRLDRLGCEGIGGTGVDHEFMVLGAGI